jgi:transposase
MYSRSAPRRRHGAEFKAKVLADCDAPGASISGVALAHGLNANLVRQWRAGRGVNLGEAAVARPVTRKAPKPTEDAAPLIVASPEFVAVEMPMPPVKAAQCASSVPTEPTPSPTPTVEALIHIELRRGPLHLNVRWPTSAARDCTAWLSELSSGLLK